MTYISSSTDWGYPPDEHERQRILAEFRVEREAKLRADRGVYDLDIKPEAETA